MLSFCMVLYDLFLWPLCLGLLVNPPAKNWVLAELLMFLFLLTIFPNFFFPIPVEVDLPSLSFSGSWDDTMLWF